MTVLGQSLLTSHCEATQATLADILTHGLLTTSPIHQWETMTEIVALVRETQVTPTPRMIALCSGDMPAALREQLLRKIRDVQYCDITMVEDGKGSHGQGQGGQGRPSHSKGKNIPQKPKTVKKMNKTAPKLPPNDAPIPTVPEAQIAQLQPELKRPPNAKKIKVKC